jgi:peroxiredoxin
MFRAVLKAGAIAPDFRIGETSLYAVLETKKTAVVFFFPKAFTPG